MSNQLVADALRLKLAETTSAIRAAIQRIRTLREDRATIARTIRLMEDERSETPDPLYAGIKPGAFTRTILDTLRQADKPLSAREIAELIAEERLGGALNRMNFERVLRRVRNGLPRLSDQLEGEQRDQTVYWRVKE